MESIPECYEFDETAAVVAGHNPSSKVQIWTGVFWIPSSIGGPRLVVRFRNGREFLNEGGDSPDFLIRSLDKIEPGIPVMLMPLRMTQKICAEFSLLVLHEAE
jgi:hypothetical protein